MLSLVSRAMNMFDDSLGNTYTMLGEAAEAMGTPLSDHQLALIRIYVRELLHWNKKMALVSVKTPQDILKHLIDSLTPIPLIMERAGTRLLDIGSGAGLPGIPLKIQMGSLYVTLIESSRKKTSFLKHVIRTLGIPDICVVHNRAESSAQEARYRGTFDVVISRAAFPIARLLTIGEPFLSASGILIAMKGQRVEEELARAENVLQKTGLVLTAFHKTRLPVTGETRKLLCLSRIES